MLMVVRNILEAIEVLFESFSEKFLTYYVIAQSLLSVSLSPY